MRGGSQIGSKTKTWHVPLEDGNEIAVRATLVENIPYAATNDSPTEHGDLWILFLSILGNDQWIAYGVVDSLVGQPMMSVKGLPFEKLKKLSILIGESWFKIKSGPMPASQRHRKLAEDVEVVNPDFESMSYLELMERREMADWEALVIHWGKQGMVISLN